VQRKFRLQTGRRVWLLRCRDGAERGAWLDALRGAQRPLVAGMGAAELQLWLASSSAQLPSKLLKAIVRQRVDGARLLRDARGGQEGLRVLAGSLGSSSMAEMMEIYRRLASLGLGRPVGTSLAGPVTQSPGQSTQQLDPDLTLTASESDCPHDEAMQGSHSSPGTPDVSPSTSARSAHEAMDELAVLTPLSGGSRTAEDLAGSVAAVQPATPPNRPRAQLSRSHSADFVHSPDFRPVGSSAAAAATAPPLDVEPALEQQPWLLADEPRAVATQEHNTTIAERLGVLRVEVQEINQLIGELDDGVPIYCKVTVGSESQETGLSTAGELTGGAYFDSKNTLEFSVGSVNAVTIRCMKRDHLIQQLTSVGGDSTVHPLLVGVCRIDIRNQPKADAWDEPSTWHPLHNPTLRAVDTIGDESGTTVCVTISYEPPTECWPHNLTGVWYVSGLQIVADGGEPHRWEERLFLDHEMSGHLTGREAGQRNMVRASYFCLPDQA
jgi:hypothetical protein